MLSIYWHPIMSRDANTGEPFETFPLDSQTPFLLLHNIRKMPRAQAISLKDAMWKVATEMHIIFNTHGGGPAGAFLKDWMGWLTKQGYHIELTGEEFVMEGLDSV